MQSGKAGWVVLALALGWTLTSCTIVRADGAAQPAELAQEWVKTELYFGANLPDGKTISRPEWTAFMDQVLTPRFPKGLTVYEAYGQMQHADGKIERQTSWVVAVLHPKDPAVDKLVAEAVDAFRARFAKAQLVNITIPVASPSFYAD